MRSLLKYKADIAVFLLIVVAVILGFLIYKKSANLSSSSTNPTGSVQSRSDRKERRPIPTGLSSDEKIIMSPPGQGATAAQKKAYADQVYKVAVSGNTLDLNKCEKPNPLVLKLKKGQDFQIKNSDTTDHTISFRSGTEYNIGAGETKTIKADFGKGAGWYGYICDGLSGLVGVFVITN